MRSVNIKLGGQERHLRYDLNSVAEVGDRLDIKLRLGHLDEDLLAVPLSLRALRVLLWAGLRHEDEKLTEEQVGAWVDLDNVGYVTDRFLELFGAMLSANGKSALRDAVQSTGLTSTTYEGSRSEP